MKISQYHGNRDKFVPQLFVIQNSLCQKHLYVIRSIHCLRKSEYIMAVHSISRLTAIQSGSIYLRMTLTCSVICLKPCPSSILIKSDRFRAIFYLMSCMGIYLRTSSMYAAKHFSISSTKEIDHSFKSRYM